MISRELERVTERLDEVLEELHAHPDPRVRVAVAEFSEGIQRIHAEALRRLADLLAEDGERFRRALGDPVISNLFLLYDLAFVDEERRARAAVESLGSFLEPRGWTAQVLAVEDGVVRLALRGERLPTAEVAELRRLLDAQLRRRLPGYRTLDIEGERLGGKNGGPVRSGDPGWEERFRTGEPVAVVPPSALERLDRELEESQERAPVREAFAAAEAEVEEEGLVGRLVDGYPVLLVRVGETGSIRAFRNACPGSILPLHLGDRDGDEIRCPWHGCRFHLGTGERLEGAGPGLDGLGVRTEAGDVWVSLR